MDQTVKVTIYYTDQIILISPKVCLKISVCVKCEISEQKLERSVTISNIFLPKVDFRDVQRGSFPTNFFLEILLKEEFKSHRYIV